MDISIRVTIPKNIFLTQEAINEIASVQRTKSAPEVRKMFKQTVEGWNHKPDFSITQRIAPSEISSRIFSSGPNSSQYALVNHGAEPHLIRPKNSGYPLRFQHGSGYKPSTRPRILSSRARSNTGAWVKPMLVHHPGFEAREFDLEIAKQYTPVFMRDMQNIINSVAQKSAQPSNQQVIK